MRTYALQQRYGDDFAFSSRRSEGMHYVCSRLSERSTEDSRTDADDSASLWKYASSVFVSRVRIFWRRELSDGRHADGRNRPTSHGRSRVELMWRWTTTRGGIFWRVVSPRGSRHLPCLFPYLLPLGFTCQGNPPAIRSLPQRIHRVAKGSTHRCVVAGYVCYDAQSYPTGPHHRDSWIHGLDFGRTSLSSGRSFPSSTQRWWPRALASLARFIMAMPNFSLW